MDKQEKQLVLICRPDFCRLLKRVLQDEGLLKIQHGNLARLDEAADAPATASGSEAFVVSADPERAARLVRLMRACPIRGGADNYFELYAIDESE